MLAETEDPAVARPATLSISPRHSPSHSPSHRHRRSKSSSTTSGQTQKTSCSQSCSDSPPSEGLEQGIRSDSSGNDHDITQPCQSRTTSSTSPETINKQEKGVSCIDGGKISTMGGPGASATPPKRSNGAIRTVRQSAGGYVAGDSPQNTSASAPPPRNGLFKMSSDHKLQVLLTRIASRDTSYEGLENMTPCSSTPADLSSEQGPNTFSPLKESPSSKPPPLHRRTTTPLDSPLLQLCANTVFKDGKMTPEAKPGKCGGVWTLNLLDGNLFLFKTNPKETEAVGEGEGEGEGKRELVEGVELSKLLKKKESGTGEDSDLYYHIPFTVLNPEVNNPHMTPVYTPVRGDKYRLYRHQDSSSMCSNEFILHHDTVFLVLEEDHPDGPVINTVPEHDLVSTLEKLADEGRSFPDGPYSAVVNIYFLSEVPESRPNNIAIYFTGRHNKYRYYVHIDKNGKLVPVKKKLPVAVNDWMNHLQFANSYDSPDGSVLVSSTNEQGASPSPGGEREPRLRKHGLSGPSLASAMNLHTSETGDVSSVPNPKPASGEKRNGVTPSENGLHSKLTRNENGLRGGIGEDATDQPSRSDDCTAAEEDGCAGQKLMGVSNEL